MTIPFRRYGSAGTGRGGEGRGVELKCPPLSTGSPSFQHINPVAASLIRKMLRSDPATRPTIEELLNDDFFSTGYIPSRLPTTCLTVPPRFSLAPNGPDSSGRKPLTEVNKGEQEGREGSRGTQTYGLLSLDPRPRSPHGLSGPLKGTAGFSFRLASSSGLSGTNEAPPSGGILLPPFGFQKTMAAAKAWGTRPSSPQRPHGFSLSCSPIQA